MISSLELRHIIETAFLPMRCICTIDHRRSMTIQLLESDTDVKAFTVTGIDSSQLTTSRAIAEIVAEIKEDFKLHKTGADKRQRKA